MDCNLSPEVHRARGQMLEKKWSVHAMKFKHRGETIGEVSFLPPVIPFNVALLIPHPMRRIMITLYFAGIRFRKYLNLGNFNL